LSEESSLETETKAVKMSTNRSLLHMNLSRIPKKKKIQSGNSRQIREVNPEKGKLIRSVHRWRDL